MKIFDEKNLKLFCIQQKRQHELQKLNSAYFQEVLLYYYYIILLDTKYAVDSFARNTVTRQKFFNGTDRLCKVVELSVQCCGKLLSDSIETY